MKNKVKWLLSTAVIAITVVLPISGFSQTSGTKSTLPKEITLATGREGTVFYIMDVGITNVVSKYSPMKVKLQPTGFIMQWGPSIKKGRTTIGHVSSSSAHAYHYGTYWWKDKPSETWMQQLTSGNDQKYAIMVRADSKIYTIKNLVGKKFYCNLPGAPSLMLFVDGLFEYYGVKHEDVKELIIPDFAEAVDEVIDKRADAVITSLGAAYPKIQAAGGCRVLPISKEAAIYQNKKYPVMSHTIVPAGYLGLPKPTLLMTDPQVFVTSKDVSEDVIYTFLKIMYDHYDEIAATHIDAKEWSLDRATMSHPIPYHAGAIKFLKEKGLWTAELEKFQKEALAKDKALKK